MKLIKITQDGIGRIIFNKTPASFDGLYTDGLQTCIAIIFVAENGITLIHATRKLSVDAILEEYDSLENVESCYLAYNPILKERADENIMRLIPEMEKRHQTFEPYVCKRGSILVTRKGIVIADFSPNRSDETLEPKDLDKRHRTNIFNNLFLTIEESMEPDIQYDVDHQTDLPALRKTPKEMCDKIKTDEFSNNFRHYFGNLMYYFLVYMPDEYDFVKSQFKDSVMKHFVLQTIEEDATRIMLQIYKAETLDQAFRRAAGFGHVQHLRLMFECDRNVLNYKGPTTGKTALHVAAERNQEKNYQFLLEHGADSTIIDKTGKTAKDYLRQSSNQSTCTMKR